MPTSKPHCHRCSGRCDFGRLELNQDFKPRCDPVFEQIDSKIDTVVVQRLLDGKPFLRHCVSGRTARRALLARALLVGSGVAQRESSGPNVRHERRKGRAAAAGTSARWRVRRPVQGTLVEGVQAQTSAPRAAVGGCNLHWETGGQQPDNGSKRAMSAAKEQGLAPVINIAGRFDLANGTAKATTETTSAETGMSHELRNASLDRRA